MYTVLISNPSCKGGSGHAYNIQMILFQQMDPLFTIYVDIDREVGIPSLNNVPCVHLLLYQVC